MSEVIVSVIYSPLLFRRDFFNQPLNHCYLNYNTYDNSKLLWLS